MIKRSGAVAAACSLLIGLLVQVFAGGVSPAQARSGPVALCDRLAADPTDPDKPADVKGTEAIAPADIQTAIKFCKAASGVSRRALFEFGRAYAAIGHCRSSRRISQGSQNSTSAMVELGVLLANGTGIARMEPRPARCSSAPPAGHPRGATSLAALTASGGAPSDPVEARAMLEKAADGRNSAEAAVPVGVMYAEGTGGPKDDVAARGLFEKAAAQGHAQALDWGGEFRRKRARGASEP